GRSAAVEAATTRLRCGGRCSAACALRRPRLAIRPRETRLPPAKMRPKNTECKTAPLHHFFSNSELLLETA
ncbi:MAG: hypothetical protein LBG79_07700, partial [Spirochaetaceae bacterium]|nr:hypothetical protein [Spirochaetaceae bacterium]